MISQVFALPVGNALRISIAPPSGVRRWKVLRKDVDAFTGDDDPSALLVHDGNDLTILDYSYLRNGDAAYYAVFYLVGGVWTAGGTASGTPSVAQEDVSVDAVELVADRLEIGFANEVKAGRILPVDGFVQVFNAPPPADTVRFPCISVHLDVDEAQEHGLGDDIHASIGDGEFQDTVGWLSQVSITIVGWTLNGDERIEIRKALKRIIAGNRDVFDSRGLSLVRPSFRDVDLVSGEMGEPMFQAVCTLTCLAPSGVLNQRAVAFNPELFISGNADVQNPHRACTDCTV